MEKDVIIPSRENVTIVTSRNVFPGREKDYEAWVHKMVAAANEAPGNTCVTSLIPQNGRGGLYQIVYRFKDQASVDGWEESPLRQKLTEEANAFSRHHRQAASGLETWFTIPGCPQLDSPPHWKQAIVTAIGVYIVSALVITIINLFDLGWNFYLENILVSVLVVAALTWVVMPFLTRKIFRRWLFKDE